MCVTAHLKISCKDNVVYLELPHRKSCNKVIRRKALAGMVTFLRDREGQGRDTQALSIPTATAPRNVAHHRLEAKSGQGP